MNTSKKMGASICGLEQFDDPSDEFLCLGDYRMIQKFAERNSEGNVVATCCSVYDGDTATFQCKFPGLAGETFLLKIRLRGIDTPELRTKDPKEKEAALVAKKVLSEMILGKECELTELGNDKYFGRTDAVIVCDGKNVCEAMLKVPKVVRFAGKQAKTAFSARA